MDDGFQRRQLVGVEGASSRAALILLPLRSALVSPFLHFGTALNQTLGVTVNGLAFGHRDAHLINSCTRAVRKVGFRWGGSASNWAPRAKTKYVEH